MICMVSNGHTSNVCSSDYFIAHADKYSLYRRIGGRVFCLISDTNPNLIMEIYENIRQNKYPSQAALFDDIYDKYQDRSLLKVGLILL